VQAVEGYQALVKLYDAGLPTGFAWVAAALFESGVLLGRMGRLEEELRVYGRLRKEFGSSRELSIRNAVAGSFVNSVVALRQLGRADEAEKYDAALLHSDFESVHRSALAVAESNRRCSVPEHLQRYWTDTANEEKGR
jgi:hypothetical protein